MARSMYGVAGLLLIVIAGVASGDEPGKKAAAEAGKPSEAGWKTDWGKFVTELATYLKRGAPHTEVKEKFEGQQVVWEGEVLEVSLKGNANSVKLKMPTQSVTLSNGGKSEMNHLHLAPVKDNGKKWEAAKVGDKVRFRTTLKGDSLFPVVSVLQGVGENTGKDRVIISTHDAELVEVIRPRLLAKPEKGPALKDDLKALAGEWQTGEKSSARIECTFDAGTDTLRPQGRVKLVVDSKEDWHGNAPFSLNERDGNRFIVFDPVVKKISGLPGRWRYALDKDSLTLSTEQGKYKGEYKLERTKKK